MSIKNDERILMLKKQIDEKKQGLGKQPRFSPITTCIFTALNGNKVNIHALTSVKDINALLVFFNMYVISANELGLDCGDVTFDGFSVMDWMEDLRSKKEVIEYTSQKEQLTTLEKKLEKLLSDDKKTELEIEAIANLIT